MKRRQRQNIVMASAAGWRRHQQWRRGVMAASNKQARNQAHHLVGGNDIVA